LDDADLGGPFSPCLIACSTSPRTSFANTRSACMSFRAAAPRPPCKGDAQARGRRFEREARQERL
jgi:hypothetical protein